MKLSRSTRAAAVVLGAVSAALLSAPTASAEVNGIDILPGLGIGATTPFGVGCTYVVVATTDTWNDPRTDIGPLDRRSTMPVEEFAWNFDGYYSTPLVFGHKVALWTPLEPGEHSVMGYQTSAGGPIDTVTVNPATPVGPICLVAP